MKRILSILIFIGLFFQSSFAQDKPAYENGFLENYCVGLNVGLYGYGIDFRTAISPQFKARIGFNYFSYNFANKGNISASVDNIGTTSATNPTLDLSFDGAKVKFPNLSILVDYYPVKKGIFSITGGFYIGSNRVTATGAVNNFQAGDAFGVPDYVIIHPDSKGQFGGTIKMGNVIKPYLGVGVGRIIPKSKVGFRAELGMIYQGKYKMSGDGNIVIPLTDTSAIADELAKLGKDGSKQLISNQMSSMMKLWPMLSFSVYYRIK